MELPLDVIIIPGILFPCHSCHSLFNINNTLVEESNVKRMPKKSYKIPKLLRSLISLYFVYYNVYSYMLKKNDMFTKKHHKISSYLKK